ncbi:winged helix-turn-helix transcriptional regulator [Candidatus Woesearchaeota archaeon]|mgnify:CR=1 FL=1|jgi:predicted ArsR family transcriptional regulator|nr:winged helix-turn-helix transcriptional regulator [Candidatus Woesearchaeota archaeon]
MIEKEVLGGLLDHKKVAVLKTLYFAKGEMYLREIAKKSGVSVSTVFRILQELSAIGLIRVKEIRMMKFYGLVRNERSRFLEGWFKEPSLLDFFVENVGGMDGVKRILLHGKLEENRANVILLGEGVDDARVKLICEKIKEKGFDLSYLILNEEQFEKLDAMGLYAGEKKVLV